MLNLITLKVLSLFSWIGSFEFVFNLLKELLNIDIEVIWYSEIDKNTIKIYEKNFPWVPNLWDVKKINTSKLVDFDMVSIYFTLTHWWNCSLCFILANFWLFLIIRTISLNLIFSSLFIIRSAMQYLPSVCFSLTKHMTSIYQALLIK